MKTPERLDDFTLAYIEAALWSSNDDATNRAGNRSIPTTASTILTPTPLRRWAEDCRRFQEENAADLALYDHPEWTAAELGGHDFWLTRNGHGCGFWDRTDCLPKEARDRLTAAAEKARESICTSATMGSSTGKTA